MKITMKDIEKETYGSSINFPGGIFTLTKCSTGEVWVHLSISSLEADIVESRMDAATGKYSSAGNT